MIDKMCCFKSKFSICALGMAVGLAWSLMTLILAFFGISFGVSTPVQLFGPVYIVNNLTLSGVLISMVWGFLYGYIFGAALAAIYNLVLKHCPCKFCKCKCNTNNCSPEDSCTTTIDHKNKDRCHTPE